MAVSSHPKTTDAVPQCIRDKSVLPHTIALSAQKRDLPPRCRPY